MRRLKQLGRAAARRPALALGRAGLTPNMLTVGGAVLTGSVGLVAAQGWFLPAAVGLALFSLTDTLDGTLARATDRVTAFGAFLDSVCDRVAEAAVFLGLVWWYQQNGDAVGVVVAYLAAAGSLMVSYTRARAEGLDLDAEVGWFQRTERLITLVAGLALASLAPIILPAVLGLLALLTTVTVFQRIAHVARASRGR